MKYSEGDRLKDLRKRDYGEGAIVGHVKDGDEFWIIRWDDSGLDNEWLDESEFEVIRPAVANHIFIFPNGNVAVTGNDEQQIPEYQGSWINFDYIRKLAEVAVRDNARITGRMPDDHLGRLIQMLGGKNESPKE